MNGRFRRGSLPRRYRPAEDAADLLLRAETLVPGAAAGDGTDAALALLRAAERCHVLSTGTPRPKRGIAGWAGLLARMGVALTHAEADSLDAAIAGSGHVAKPLTSRVVAALPSLLNHGPLDGVPQVAPSPRPTPLPPSILAEIRGVLRERGVRRGTVLGSWARGEERPDSDVDVLVRGEASWQEHHGRIHLHVVSRADLAALRGVAAQGAWREGIPVTAGGRGVLRLRRTVRWPHGKKPVGRMRTGEFFDSVEVLTRGRQLASGRETGRTEGDGSGR